jgi:hypothetical protein
MKVATKDDEEVIAHPVEPLANGVGRSSLSLERPKLIVGERRDISLIMMGRAERDHAGRIVVMPDPPRWVEVMPLEKWATTVFDRAAKANLAAQFAPNVNRRGSRQPFLASVIRHLL